jgi:hypothetical protein
VRQVNMTISLAFLAPDLVRAAVEGRLPRGIGVERLRDAPAEWSQQFEALGLESAIIMDRVRNVAFGLHTPKIPSGRNGADFIVDDVLFAGRRVRLRRIFREAVCWDQASAFRLQPAAKPIRVRTD